MKKSKSKNDSKDDHLLVVILGVLTGIMVILIAVIAIVRSMRMPSQVATIKTESYEYGPLERDLIEPKLNDEHFGVLGIVSSQSELRNLIAQYDGEYYADEQEGFYARWAGREER